MHCSNIGTVYSHAERTCSYNQCKLFEHKNVDKICLLERRVNCPKTIVFVRQYSDCSNFYLMIQSKMGSNFTETPGYPDHVMFRLAEMYSRVAMIEKKEQWELRDARSSSLFWLHLIPDVVTRG